MTLHCTNAGHIFAATVVISDSIFIRVKQLLLLSQYAVPKCSVFVCVVSLRKIKMNVD